MLRQERELRVFENRFVRRIIGPRGEEVTGSREDGIMRSLIVCSTHQILCW